MQIKLRSDAVLNDDRLVARTSLALDLFNTAERLGAPAVDDLDGLGAIALGANMADDIGLVIIVCIEAANASFADGEVEDSRAANICVIVQEVA